MAFPFPLVERFHQHCVPDIELFHRQCIINVELFHQQCVPDIQISTVNALLLSNYSITNAFPMLNCSIRNVLPKANLSLQQCVPDVELFHRQFIILCRGWYLFTARRQLSDPYTVAALCEKDADNYGEEDLLIEQARCQKNLEKRRKLSCDEGSREGAKWRWVRAPLPAFFDSISAFFDSISACGVAERRGT